MQVGELYKHKKEGDIYKITGFAIHETSGNNKNKTDVIYQTADKQIDDDCQETLTCVKHEFLEAFEIIEEASE